MCRCVDYCGLFRCFTIISVLIEAPKARLTVQTETSQIFRGETVTLTCDIQGEDWTYTWQCGDEQQNSDEEEFKITVQFNSHARRYACSVENKTALSQGVMLTVEGQLRVQPDGRVFRGQTVTLTCDIQDTDVTNWSYIWNKDDSEIHVSQSQEYRISSVSESHTGNYSCTGRETGGSRYSHSSEKVTLTVSGECVQDLCLSLLIISHKTSDRHQNRRRVDKHHCSPVSLSHHPEILTIS
uniref:Ig-like domain-containing protein n=1 Tax=Cyprinus carpio TaxID=7962 RepID=A0A8C2Q1E5_CYPCA